MQFVRDEQSNGNVGKKSFILAVFLSTLSTILIISGFIEDVQAWDPTKGAMFWLLGGLTGIPGFYVLKKLRDAWKAPAGS